MTGMLTACGETTEGQLFGGAQDGRDILVPLINGRPPLTIIRSGGRYFADGCVAGGLIRYSLDGWQRASAPPNPSPDIHDR